ncbi:MAG: phosphatase PAP2 family protein [Sandaracinaceae bacterium]|nr:phosphatase PAP2 family protein [Sandaracinaceae bacterium]
MTARALLTAALAALAIGLASGAACAQEDPPEDDEREESSASEQEERDDREEDVVGSIGRVVHDIGEAMQREAPERARIRWSPSWPRYRFDELVLTLGMGLVIALAEFLPTRSEPNWSGVTILDRGAQDALGLADHHAREGVEIASDVLVSTLVIWPLLVDSLLYAGVGEGAWDVAWQLSLISLEVFADQPRAQHHPEAPEPARAPHQHLLPRGAGVRRRSLVRRSPPAESFWSGHVSNAFAGAALVCLHHDVLDLFGDAGTDGAICGAALAAATTTGLFRIMSDRHWITDTLTGALVGSLVGVLVPWLLHYQGGARPPLRGSSPPVMVFVTPTADESTLGLSASGFW